MSRIGYDAGIPFTNWHVPLWRNPKRQQVIIFKPPFAPDTPDYVKRVIGAKGGDRKSTRLNSSHGYISYAVFCLKKKTNTQCLAPYYQLSRCRTASLIGVRSNRSTSRFDVASHDNACLLTAARATRLVLVIIFFD